MNTEKSKITPEKAGEIAASQKPAAGEMPQAAPENSPNGARMPASKQAEGEIPLIPWEDIAHGHGQLDIAFQGMIYHLRVTRNGKLILTK